MDTKNMFVEILYLIEASGNKELAEKWMTWRTKKNTELNHERLQELFDSVCNILLEKNQEYGNSWFNILDEYGLIPFELRIQDKIERFKQQSKKGLDSTDTLMDIAGYAMLTLYYLKTPDGGI